MRRAKCRIYYNLYVLAVEYILYTYVYLLTTRQSIIDKSVFGDLGKGYHFQFFLLLSCAVDVIQLVDARGASDIVLVCTVGALEIHWRGNYKERRR